MLMPSLRRLSLTITALTALGLSLSGCTKCSKSSDPAATTAAAPTTADSSAPVTDAAPPSDQLGIVDTVVGTGVEAVDGKKVTVHYTGTLINGTKFDSSLDRSQPFSFQLGAGQVIAGWDQGVKGMKIGGKRKLTIPPQMGYGEQGVSEIIPPNSTLLFDVELLNVE